MRQILFLPLGIFDSYVSLIQNKIFFGTLRRISDLTDLAVTSWAFSCLLNPGLYGSIYHTRIYAGTILVQAYPGSKVRIRRETYISPTTGNEEDCLVAYVVGNGVMTCKVGFLPRHLSIRRADDYDGVYARVVEVYSPRSLNITKRQKRHRNLGCCVAKILGNAPVRSL